MRMRIGMLATVATLALTPAVASAAADRYASPTSLLATPCTQAQPCDIVDAVNGATTGDNITIEPGTYGSPTPVNTNLTDAGQTLDIHGEAGQPRPVIITTAAYGFNLNGGSTLSDVQINDTADDMDAIYISVMPSAISDVMAEESGGDGIACDVDGTVNDSLCWASGSDGVAAAVTGASSLQATFNNDTLIASGAGDGAEAVYAYELLGTMTVNLNNTIARGAAIGIFAEAGSSATANVTASFSNFANVYNDAGGGTVNLPAPGSATNQTAAPQFVDVIGGDFHEISDSPTIGAGANLTGDGTTDLDGNPREIRGKTDIGAYEFLPPPACTSSSASTKFQTQVAIQLHCLDYTGAALTYAIASKPAHGTLSAPTAAGAVTYTPKTGYSGTDTFTFVASSAHGSATAATVAITIAKEPAPALSGLKLNKGTLHFTLNESAAVTLTFAEKGHKSHSVKLKGKAGKNSYKIKKLKPGKYKITIAATDAGGRAKKKSLSLKIKTPARH